MSSDFLIYGANGYVGEAAARLAAASGLRPILAGRDETRLTQLAAELGLEYRVFDLADPDKIEAALQGLPVVLHCAGPYIHTWQPMVEACLKTGTHYLDLTGEIPVYAGIAVLDTQARARGIMLMPGAGFDVVPTDCLAVYLKQRLPSATHLALAFQAKGPGGLPPGTQKTAIELITFGDRVRSAGQLVVPESMDKTREVDFGDGPITARLFTWGDVFTAYYSTAIPNIEDYTIMPEAVLSQMAAMRALGPLAKMSTVRSLLKRGVRPGPSAEQRAATVMHVWGEVTDDQGGKAAARLHGPEAGLVWTTRASLAAVKKVLAGSAPHGFQTPGMAYGADFVLESEGVTREDIP